MKTGTMESESSYETGGPRLVHKDDVLERISHTGRGMRKRYQDFFIGESGWLRLFQYEVAQVFAAQVPGAIGYVLRKYLLLPLLGRAGSGVQLGRITVRHPGKITIGDRTAIDDGCVLDARGVAHGQFRIGSDVLIARRAELVAKTDRGFIEIGDHCIISNQCILASSGGIRLGKWVGIAGGCYIGGGRYKMNRPDIPMMKQDLYTEGPVIIEDDCWIGAGCIILDGVTIGRGSIIGAGAIVRQDIPPFTVVTPHQRLVMLPRVTDTGDSDTHEAS